MNELDFINALSSNSARTDGPELIEALKFSSIKCKGCSDPATKALMWCEHKAFIPSCDACVETLIKKHSDCWTPADGNRPEAIKDISYIEKHRKEKKAGVKELVSKGVQFASNNKAPLLGAIIGSAAATALQYKANKPNKSGVSKQRMAAEKSLASHDRSMEETKQMGTEPGFLDQMRHARAKSTLDVSKIMEKHPARGALLAAPGGAMVGSGVGLAVRKLLGG